MADQNIPILSDLEEEITSIILANSSIQEFPKGTEILREGQYVKVIPIIIEGLVKVYTSHEDRDLLLYYIQPNESCIMSFTAGVKNATSKIFARCEEDSKILLLPAEKMNRWIQDYPQLNEVFLDQYNHRYLDLIETINHVLFDKMDKRLYDYLIQRKALSNEDKLKISHNQIAHDLGTAREVISRVMKKLEHEGKVKQTNLGIELPTSD